MPSGLGRGLGSLIPKKINNTYSDFDLKDQNNLEIADKSRILYLDPTTIKINPVQPRSHFSENGIEDLAKSIKEHGILQPLVVTKNGTDFELIAGERRLRAAKSLHLNSVPVIVREADKQKKLELALIENLQRENLNPIETAIAYNQLINEFSLKQEEVADKVGQSRSTVANILRFLNLPAEIQLALIEKKITEAHAKYLLGLDSPAKQLSIFKKILINNLSVRDTDKLIKQVGGTKSALVKINYHDQAQEESLRKHLGTKAEIKRAKRGGQIVINFSDDEQLREVVAKIVNG